MIYAIIVATIFTLFVLAIKLKSEVECIVLAREKVKNFQSEFYEVSRYIIDKYLDGLSIGFIFVVLAPLDKSEKFVKSVDELLTSINPAIVLFGWLCASGYLWIAWFYPTDGKDFRAFVLRITSSWFDLVQQFFALAVGAFFPIKIFLVLKATGWENFSGEMNNHAAAFVAILVLAIVFAGLWVLKDDKLKNTGGHGPKTWHKVVFALNLFFGIVLATTFFVDEVAASKALRSIATILAG